jgi:tetratricopeptide (TPR) repeat protein
MMRLRALFLPLLLAALGVRTPLTAQRSQPAKAQLTSVEERAALHASPDWKLVEPHLADPATASAAQLELQGDVLRARRFPEDALDYYGYAIARGGDVSVLLKKMGVVRLELQQAPLARSMFLRCVRAHKNDPEAWNDLAATDYVLGAYATAISEYKHAVRLDKSSAVMHSNLGMAYFANKDTDRARAQFALALRLDPKIMESRDEGGVTAHILATKDFAGLCFEMAIMFAQQQKPQAMRLWLSKASERGYDVREGMRDNAVFHPYLKDPQIVMMLQNTSRMHKGVALADVPETPAPDKVD